MSVPADDDLVLSHGDRVGDDGQLDGGNLLEKSLKLAGGQQGPLRGIIGPDDLKRGPPVLHEHELSRRGSTGLLPPCESGPRERGDQQCQGCLLYTSPSPRDRTRSRMPSSA